jgi:hypothetical protein
MQSFHGWLGASGPTRPKRVPGSDLRFDDHGAALHLLLAVHDFMAGLGLYPNAPPLAGPRRSGGRPRRPRRQPAPRRGCGRRWPRRKRASRRRALSWRRPAPRQATRQTCGRRCVLAKSRSRTCAQKADGDTHSSRCRSVSKQVRHHACGFLRTCKDRTCTHASPLPPPRSRACGFLHTCSTHDAPHMLHTYAPHMLHTCFTHAHACGSCVSAYSCMSDHPDTLYSITLPYTVCDRI